jgi:hypothetical protein
MNKRLFAFCLAAAVLACLSSVPPAQAAANVFVINGDPGGTGFNDPTAAAPVGGNSGTTVGEQRLIAFRAAADKWGATLTSSQPILILAFFTPLACNANAGVLGPPGHTGFSPTSPASIPERGIRSHWQRS